MNSRQLQDGLRELLEDVLFARDDRDDPVHELADHLQEIRQVATYEDVGILTSDKGLVVETYDGGEFQLTIVQSRAGTDDRSYSGRDGE